MQDATVQTDLHSPRGGGNLPPITREPTGSPGNNEPTVHDEPTGTLKDAPQVPLSGPETTAKTYFYRASKQLRTWLGSEFAYY